MCTWNITVPSGYIIKLSFLYFRLEPYQYSPCYYSAPGARVTVTNVTSDDGYQPFMLCGQQLPDPVYSVGNSVQVIFTSLSSQYSGFNATYTAITYSSGTWYTLSKQKQLLFMTLDRSHTIRQCRYLTGDQKNRLRNY